MQVKIFSWNIGEREHILGPGPAYRPVLDTLFLICIGSWLMMFRSWKISITHRGKNLTERMAIWRPDRGQD